MRSADCLTAWTWGLWLGALNCRLNTEHEKSLQGKSDFWSGPCSLEKLSLGSQSGSSYWGWARWPAEPGVLLGHRGFKQRVALSAFNSPHGPESGSSCRGSSWYLQLNLERSPSQSAQWPKILTSLDLTYIYTKQKLRKWPQSGDVRENILGQGTWTSKLPVSHKWI